METTEAQSIKESDDISKDLGICEKELLDGMDSYMEEISARLIVSRMVGESTIKGMVNAIQEEAAEKVALKEAEIDALNERLNYYESFVNKSNKFDKELEPKKQKLESCCLLAAKRELDFVKHLDRLKIAVEEQLRKLPEGAWKDSVNEQEWADGIQREIGSLMVQSLIKNLLDEFEKRICEQRSLMNSICMNWGKRVDEISSVRQDFDTIYRSLSYSDSGLLVSHRSIENIEEWNNGKRKDHVPWKIEGNQLSSAFCRKEIGNGKILMETSEEPGKHISGDSPQLKCMTKEALIACFKEKMSRMKRQHELALHEKTEELFSLKRDLLKEKGSSHFQFYKEKYLESMRKKISDLILKLDGFLLENEKLSAISYEQDISHGLKEKIDAFFYENRWLQGLLVHEQKYTNHIASQISTEPNFIEEIERLKLAIEEMKIEATIKEEKYKSVFKDLVSDLESNKEDLETAAKIIEDNYCILYRGVIADVLSRINPVILVLNKEKDSINTVLLEKNEALCLKNEENERLKREISSLSTLVKEKEKLAFEVDFRLWKQMEQFDLVCHELDLHKDKVSKQEMIIASTKSELDSLKGKLDEAFWQIYQKEVEIRNLNQKIKITSDALEELERQNDILTSDIHEKQEKLVSAITKDKEHKRQLESILVSITGLSKAFLDCGCRFSQKMETNESRLKQLSRQCSQFKQQSNLLKRKLSWYKERLDARCQDLQKAEIEVDLLGDEVETLLGLLERIYIALDHYSPVLQHYAGVVWEVRVIVLYYVLLQMRASMFQVPRTYCPFHPIYDLFERCGDLEIDQKRDEPRNYY